MMSMIENEGVPLSLNNLKPGLFFRKYRIGKDKDPEPYVIHLLKLGDKSIWMSSNLHLGFFKRKAVEEAITATARRVKDFRLLLDASVNWEQAKKELSWLVGLMGEGRIMIRRSRFRIPHWLIVDRKHIRLEKMHSPEEIGSENYIMINTDEAVADMLNWEWDKMWESADLIDH